MDATGAEYPREFNGQVTSPIQGRSLLPLLQGKEREGHDWLYFQFSNNRAIRQRDWKAVSARGGRWELYDLANDRSELHDLASRQPQKLEEMKALWHRVAKDVDQAPKNHRKPAGKSLQTFSPGQMTKRAAGPKPTGSEKKSSGQSKSKKKKP